MKCAAISVAVLIALPIVIGLLIVAWERRP